MKLEFNFKQSGVIPYRQNNGTTEVLLITSMKKKKWIIPKGYIEFNLSPFESAKKEAFEEAGVLGSNETIEIGSYRVHKEIGVSYVKVFSMEVIKILEDYPEKNHRKRKWYNVKDAIETVQNEDLAEVLSKFYEHFKKN